MWLTGHLSLSLLLHDLLLFWAAHRNWRTSNGRWTRGQRHLPLRTDLGRAWNRSCCWSRRNRRIRRRSRRRDGCMCLLLALGLLRVRRTRHPRLRCRRLGTWLLSKSRSCTWSAANHGGRDSSQTTRSATVHTLARSWARHWRRTSTSACVWRGRTWLDRYRRRSWKPLLAHLVLLQLLMLLTLGRMVHTHRASGSRDGSGWARCTCGTRSSRARALTVVMLLSTMLGVLSKLVGRSHRARKSTTGPRTRGGRP